MYIRDRHVSKATMLEEDTAQSSQPLGMVLFTMPADRSANQLHVIIES